jgi:predicted metal-binding membrane protein
MSDAALEALVRRDRIVVGATLAVLVVAASLYLRHLASAMVGMAMPDMPSMPGMVMTMHPWNWVEIGTLVVMWAVMMVAMMMPAAAPMILMFATIYRRRAAAGRTAVPTAIFVLAYLVVWAIFSVVAAVAQAGLHAAALLSPAMAATSPWLAGGLLIVAGMFQWTPLKRACLAACRSPLSFLMTGWSEGRGGAFLMGLRHGYPVRAGLRRRQGRLGAAVQRGTTRRTCRRHPGNAIAPSLLTPLQFLDFRCRLTHKLRKLLELLDVEGRVDRADVTDLDEAASSRARDEEPHTKRATPIVHFGVLSLLPLFQRFDHLRHLG